MKRIYLVRHGQTDYNLKGIVQGSGINAPLNETGRAQAQAFYQNFRSIPFDKVYTSALKRTEQSVASFIDITPHEKFTELNEISWGDLEGKEVDHLRREQMKTLINGWKNGEFDLSPINGESPNDVAQRTKQFVPIITRRTNEKNILICSHGRAMRVFLCVLLGLPLTEMDRFAHQNLCLYELGYSEKNGFEIIRENYTGHLH
ncbi:MAG: histidine phosphatase family protein [Bacteroidia bacterium]